MNIHNEIDNDVRTVRVSEMQDLLGESDMPSTLAPFVIPAGIYTPPLRKKKGERSCWHDNEQRKKVNAHRRPFGDIDRKFTDKAKRRVQVDVLAEDYYAEMFDSTNGSYNPEDAMNNAIDAQRHDYDTDEALGIAAKWRLCEQYVMDDPRGDLEEKPLHRTRIREITRSASHPSHKEIEREQSRLYRERRYHYSWSQLWTVAESFVRSRHHDQIHTICVTEHDVPEQRDAEEQSEARMLNRDRRERRNGYDPKGDRRASYRNGGRKRPRRKGRETLRYVPFDDWSNYFVEGDERYLEQEALRELDDIEEERFQEWLSNVEIDEKYLDRDIMLDYHFDKLDEQFDDEAAA